MRFELADLPYEFNALEPYISKKSLELHYIKYYKTYLTDLNNLITGTKFKNLDLETIIKVSDGPIYNNAAQVWNHTFYFESLQPDNNSPVKSHFNDIIKMNFGTVTFFKNSFAKAVESLFGAGWVWLVLNHRGKLEVVQKSNAGNPLRIGLIPLLTCDVWEHAYYLDYQNSRHDYLEAFWKLINWDMIRKRYDISYLTTD